MFWKESEHPLLVSFHIPKTAGTSFAEVLTSQYGVRLGTLYYSTPSPDEEIHLLDRARSGDIPLDWAQSYLAIHGHFPAHPNWASSYPDAFFLTWLRDPLARIASHYRFLQRLKKPEGDVALTFAKASPTLMEFCTDARYHRAVHAYAYYLAHFPEDKWNFIGSVEHFSDDLQWLSQRLQWKKVQIPHRNKAIGEEQPLSAEEQKWLRETVLVEEYEWYYRFMKLREKLRLRG